MVSLRDGHGMKRPCPLSAKPTLDHIGQDKMTWQSREGAISGGLQDPLGARIRRTPGAEVLTVALHNGRGM